VKGEGLAGAFKGIEHTIHQALNVALWLKVNVQVFCLCDKGYALLRIVQIGDTLVYPTACQTSAAFAYFLFADGNQLCILIQGNAIVAPSTYDESFHDANVFLMAMYET
jgi:hypothetical protein